ncbi:hypothetical protein SK128_022216, partial [Halocaridina rubra]
KPVLKPLAEEIMSNETVTSLIPLAPIYRHQTLETVPKRKKIGKVRRYCGRITNNGQGPFTP